MVSSGLNRSLPESRAGLVPSNLPPVLGGHAGSSVLVPLMRKVIELFTAIGLLLCLLNPFSSGLWLASRAFLGGRERSGGKMTVRAASAMGLI